MENIQLWLAVYGAVVGTIAVGWQIWSTVRDRPDLQVSASAPSRVFKPEADQGGHVAFNVSYPIAITNGGTKRITLISGDFEFSLRPMIPSDAGLGYDGDKVLSMSRDLFPLKLDSGEAKTITLTLKLEATAGQGFQKGYTGDFKFRFETTQGSLERKTTFVLDAYTLNRRMPY